MSTLSAEEHVACAAIGVPNMVLSHPYMEDSVVLPTRNGIRSENRLAERDLSCKKSHNDVIASRWCSATWINLLVNKHACFPAGLIWSQECFPISTSLSRGRVDGDRQEL